MSRLQETHRRINAELSQEKAAALGRAGERLEAALSHAAELKIGRASCRERV